MLVKCTDVFNELLNNNKSDDNRYNILIKILKNSATESFYYEIPTYIIYKLFGTEKLSDELIEKLKKEQLSVLVQNDTYTINWFFEDEQVNNLPSACLARQLYYITHNTNYVNVKDKLYNSINYQLMTVAKNGFIHANIDIKNIVGDEWAKLLIDDLKKDLIKNMFFVKDIDYLKLRVNWLITE